MVLEEIKQKQANTQRRIGYRNTRKKSQWRDNYLPMWGPFTGITLRTSTLLIGWLPNPCGTPSLPLSPLLPLLFLSFFFLSLLSSPSLVLPPLLFLSLMSSSMLLVLFYSLIFFFYHVTNLNVFRKVVFHNNNQWD